MPHFMGGLDGNGQPLPITYRRLRVAADGWHITPSTPEGPARLLKASADMFALGFYSYELVACSNSWSIFAVEAALKHRLGAAEKVPYAKLIEQASEKGLVPDHLAKILHNARDLRNGFVHEGIQPNWTFGMAAQVIGSSFKIVATLYPD